MVWTEDPGGAQMVPCQASVNRSRLDPYAPASLALLSNSSTADCAPYTMPQDGCCPSFIRVAYAGLMTKWTDASAAHVHEVEPMTTLAIEDWNPNAPRFQSCSSSCMLGAWTGGPVPLHCYSWKGCQGQLPTRQGVHNLADHSAKRHVGQHTCF